MKILWICFAVALCLCVCSPNAHARFETGNEFLVACTGAYQDEVKAVTAPIHCAGYVEGVVDTYVLMLSVYSQTTPTCIPPEGADIEQVLAGAIFAIQKDAALSAMPARVIIIKTLNSLYPCQE